MAPGNWIDTTLGEILDVKHGFAFKGEYIQNEPVGNILLTPGNFAIGGGFKADKYKFYTGPVCVDFILCEGDLVVTMTDLSKQTDTLGYPAIVPAPPAGRLYLHNQRLGKIVLKAGAPVDMEYLFYLLCTRDYRDEILASSSGTTVKHTSPKHIQKFHFKLPPVSQQQAIADVLSTLDDKIELNRRMNQTIEEMARSLFKSWFVDFDPVRAKAEGSLPSGMDAETASLFPDGFEDSELGPIPRGWSVGQLSEVLAEIETGSRPRGGVRGISHGVPSVGAESIIGMGIFEFSKTKYVPRDFFEAMKKGQVRDRDVLLYKDGGRPGEFEPHVSMFGNGFPFREFAINEHVYRIRTNAKLSQALLYFWLSSDLIMHEMRAKGTGVAIPGINSRNAKSLTTLIPTPGIVEAFDHLVDPLIITVFANCNQIKVLASIRETLLPKLLYGELRIDDPEGFLDELLP